MISRAESFWIAFIVRFAFGFLFLFAALGIFKHGVEAFANGLSGPLADTWMGDIEASVVSLSTGLFSSQAVPFEDASRSAFLKGFLTALPYVMCGLAVCILTGILLRPALRIGALLLVMLGLGKYLQNDVAATANDFFFAFMICAGLFFLGLRRRTEVVVAEVEAEEALA
jgi:hypothetical protein